MQFWLNLLVVVQVSSALVMIGLVLVQHGKGADMGASFGSGASGSLFGATGSANFLSRSTAACATLFFVCTLALAYMSSSVSMQPSSTDSVLDKAAAPASAPTQGAIPGMGAPPTVTAVPTPAASAPAGTIPTR